MGPRRRHGPGAGRRGRRRTLHVIVGAANLAESIRRFGHLAAKLDPLGSAQIGDSTLLPKTHGITDDDLKRLPASLVGGPPAESSSNAYEAIEKLRRVYCSTTGFDIAHLFVPEERAWMREAAESGRYLPLMDPREQRSAARPPHPGGSVRALPAAHLHRQDALLDRRPRHADARPRRGHGRGGGHRHAPSDARHGAPRPAQRAGAHPAEAVRAHPGRVQGSDRPCRCCGWISAGWAT